MSAQTGYEVMHIPGSLKLLSYLFFLSGVVEIVFDVFIMGLDLFGKPTGDLFLIAWFASGIVLGFLLIGMSRGLRRGSRGCRTCALFLTWVGFAIIAYKAYLMFAPHLQDHPYPKPPELTTPAIAGLTCLLLIQLWQFRVLTRPDVVDFFYRRP